MHNLIILVIIFFHISCSSNELKSTTAVLDEVYISSGVEQFSLGLLPEWANFSKIGSCHRKSSVRYMNFENIHKSFHLDYSQALHLQHMFNRKINAYKLSSGAADLLPKDESYIFHNVYQQVLGGRYDFIVPKFSQVSVVWIDHFLGDLKKLKKIVQRQDVLAGHPILLSDCLSSHELEQLAKKLKIDVLGTKYLSSEMFTIYNRQMEKKSMFIIDLSQILQGKNIKFFGKKRVENIKGEYKFIKLK